MHFTVEQALQMEGMNQCTLLAGMGGLSNEIAFVDTMEVPDIAPWLREKEFLVTTGYSIRKDKQNVLHLIESLHQAGASGLAIKMRFLGGLPEEALVLADQYSLPLIAIPDEIPMLELSTPLFRAVLDMQNKRLKFSSDVHNRFTKLELSGGGLAEIADMLHRLLSMPIVITDRNFNISVAVPDGTLFREFFQAVLPQLQDWERHAVDCGDTARFQCGQQYVNVRRAQFKGQICSYILAFCQENDFDEMHMIALDHAAATTALEFSKLDALNQRLSLMENNFFFDIIMRSIKSEEEAQQRAQYLGWQKPPFSLVVYNINDFEELAHNHSELEILALKQQVAEEIRQVMIRQDIPCNIISKSDSTSCLCTAPAPRQLVYGARTVVQCIGERLGIGLTAGISVQVSHFTDLCTAYEEAADALVIGRKTGTSVTYAGDIYFERAVLRTADPQYFQQFVQKTVESLFAYDKKHHTEFVHTLRVLVEHMGIRARAAQALFLHRNTLLSRIRRIEEITGCDLSRNEQLLELGIALKIRSLL